MLSPGDRYAWADDPQHTGTVLKVSDEIRRDWEGNRRPELPPMVYVQADHNPLTGRKPGRKHWAAPELLRRIES